MASTGETTKTGDKKELTAAQLSSLIQATGQSESEIRASYDSFAKKFPNGFLTEEEFTARFHESELWGKQNKFSPSKHLFAVADRNNSGTVDLYEYLLVATLLANQDPKTIIKCLFKLFDCNQDGVLQQSEVVDVLYTFFSLLASSKQNEDEEKPEYSLEDIKDDVIKAFQNKTEVSEKEFYNVCMNSEIIQQVATRLGTLYTFGLIFSDADFE
ncbi:unnamed protein product [Rotaria magnacalcarata]|uniref:EF-hand domain-containing protein n=1 Tax=Rotaria magnacalcarata TaxID=392030 RepID=A0A820IJM0_9BILA|nr:unnamed protein product [Rotaria magnacalcarata]CAF1343081.1 unnamed protein product [Rotaria magnacalcarata]CAF2102150.1 unnamed protein product [Rotaria magnacalcarata]CAF2168938.1 unnamed protein product [Rotaria magnacalcarata]CAF3944135.1 unnamed protein product [Rotaria magnacalcarata]